MKISVLICTYKRLGLLDKCLEYLIKGTIERPDEIVIVDGDEGKANKVIKKWQKYFPDLKIIPTKNINLAVSRNIGLSYCAGDVIAMTDDDVRIRPEWVKKIKKLHEKHPEAGAIGGKIESAGDKFIDNIANAIIFPFGEKPGCVPTVAGANVSYKKKVIQEVGRYDEGLFRGEDVDYNWRIIKKHYNIYYTPDLKVYHCHRSSWGSLAFQVFMYGRAYYLVREKWKDMYCVYPHQLKSLKDVGKILYFFAGAIFESMLRMGRIKSNLAKPASFCLFLVYNLIWKLGIMIEMVNHRVLKRKIRY